MLSPFSTFRGHLARAVAAALVVTALLAPPALAGAPDRTGSRPRHCVQEIEPLRPGETRSRASRVRCFASVSEAIYAATGGRVRLAPGVTPDRITDRLLGQDASRLTASTAHRYGASYVIGQVWSGSGFGGASWTIHTLQPRMCDGYSYGDTYSPRWQNVVSSARAYGNCRLNTQYDGVRFNGARGDCGNNWTSCAYMGRMGNEASSWRIHGLRR
jgi:hypothetical protein